MHPSHAFDWDDQAAMLAFVGREAFAHIFTADNDGLFVVHAPVLVVDGRAQFHVSRRNRIADHLAGRACLMSIAGRHAYQSANWYVSANQVPTWHYEAVEIEGIAEPVDETGLTAMLDGLSAVHEGRVQSERPWTRGKMDERKFEAMLHAIVGFEVTPTAIRGTRKFNQHKQSADLQATIRGQAEAGRRDIVQAITELSPE